MNRKWWKFLFLLPISVCTLYAGGYAAQFIKNYQEWTSAGNFAGNGTYPQAASLTPNIKKLYINVIPKLDSSPKEPKNLLLK